MAEGFPDTPESGRGVVFLQARQKALGKGVVLDKGQEGFDGREPGVKNGVSGTTDEGLANRRVSEEKRMVGPSMPVWFLRGR